MWNNNPPNVILTVEGMMCQNSCGKTVHEAISSVTQVQHVVVSYEKKEVQVWGTGFLLSEVLSAVEDVGFEPLVKYSNLAIQNGRSSRQKDKYEANGINENESWEEGGAGEIPPDMVLNVKGMFDAKSCPEKVRNIALTVDGVFNAEVDFDKKKISVWGFADLEAVVGALASAGYVGIDANSNSPKGKKKNSIKAIESDENGPLTRITIKYFNKTVSTPSIMKFMAKLKTIQVYNLKLDLQTFDIVFNSTKTTSENIMNILKKELDNHFELKIIGKHSAIKGDLTDLNKSFEKEVRLTISGMTCANCSAKVERTVKSMPGVVSVTVSSMTNAGRVVINEHLENSVGIRDIIERIKSIGYGCEIESALSMSNEEGGMQPDEMSDWLWRLSLSILLGVPVMILHAFMHEDRELMKELSAPLLCNGSINNGQVLMFILNTPVLIGVGYRYYKSALIGAYHGSYGMDFLVMTGTSITYIYSCVQLFLACSEGSVAKHVFFETTGMLLMFVTIGKFIEGYAKGKTISAITDLLKLQPKEALLVTKPSSDMETEMMSSKDQSSQNQLTFNRNPMHDNTDVINSPKHYQEEVTKTISVELLQRGDLLKVLPGDRLPADGVVVLGSSYVDESMITGEPMAVLRGVGDNVYGSTINQNNCLYVKVECVGSDSALAQIVQLVRNAQMNKAPVQAYADQLASIFTPFILALSLATFIVWSVLSVTHIIPASWFQDEYGNPYLFSMLFAISVVVISCPCALGLATPTAILVGTSVGATNGILVKGGSAFEMAHRIKTVIFDKTGTLTAGKPSVTDEILLEDISKSLSKSIGEEEEKANGKGIQLPFPSHTIANKNINGHLSPILSDIGSASSSPIPFMNESDQGSRDMLLRLAASAEQRSEHPIAQSISYAAKSRHLPLFSIKDSSFEFIEGSGVVCEGDDGRIIVGNRKLLEMYQVTITSLIDTAMWDLEVQGKTAVCVALDSKVLGIIGISDELKPEANSVICALRTMGMDVWMLTGDNRTTSDAIADRLDIPKERVLSALLPKDKVAKVEELQQLGQIVAMIGDGINDSPALAQADLGVAIGAGTQVAIEAADMVLIRSYLFDLVVALDLSKVVFSRIRMNFIWAGLYNIISIPFAAGVIYPWTKVLLPPQYAGLAMAASSLSVVVSSMMLKCYKRPFDEYKFQPTHTKMIKPNGILEKAKKNLIHLKENLQQIGRNSRTRSMASGPRYKQLARDEMEADQSLGLELGIGGTSGMKFSTSNHLTSLDDADGIV